jgi:sodium-dependent dicarboxylate transporter 2/3/5
MSTPEIADETSPLTRKIGYFLGPLLFLLTYVLPAPEPMSAAAWHTCGIALWMASWWITEAMPLPVTSLLPIVLLPLFAGLPFKQVLTPYAGSIIFLFLGGFLLSIAMEKWNLHVRIGLGILKLVGVGAKSILAGLMVATAFMGMWMSNTATTIMMLPMALSIAQLLKREGGNNHFAKAAVLGVAYGAVIGGLGTFVGTPTNAILQGHMSKHYGYEFSLADWMSFGVPLLLVLLALAWLLLCARFMRGADLVDNVRALVHESFSKLGRMQPPERVVMAVFALVASLWAFSGFIEGALGISLDDAAISIFGAMLLFTIPVNRKLDQFALSWKDTQKLPWGILIFFGGSLSVSDALTATGVTQWLSGELSGLSGMSLLVIVSVVVVLLVVVSEMMSNVATITAFLPILSAMAAAMGINPLLILVPATLAASCAFMLPGASAPNAMAYGTGELKISDMVKTGLILDIVCALAIVACTFTLVTLAFGIEPGVVPQWAISK